MEVRNKVELGARFGEDKYPAREKRPIYPAGGNGKKSIHLEER